MARNCVSGVYIPATLFLLICSQFGSGVTQTTPAPQQVPTPHQTLYRGLNVLAKAAKTAAIRNFAPFNKPRQEAIKYWDSIFAICPVLDQYSELETLIASETTNATTIELEAVQGIMNNTLIDACEWMKVISETSELYNCSSINVAALSINSLCVFMKAHEMAKKSFMGMRRFLYPGVHRAGGQINWIESTFTGHAQASTVLPLLNTVSRFNCNTTEMGNVTCSSLV